MFQPIRPEENHLFRFFIPPNGGEPQRIPGHWRDDSKGEVRTDLPDLTDEELNALGWKGPIQLPTLPGTSHYTHDYKWNKETLSYDTIEVTQFEKEKRVNYQLFWDCFINSSAYLTIKATASQSLAANTIATEFIALISDAKNSHANIEKIQGVLTEIIDNISFTQEELDEIQTIFTESGMFAVYTLA